VLLITIASTEETKGLFGRGGPEKKTEEYVAKLTKLARSSLRTGDGE